MNPAIYFAIFLPILVLTLTRRSNQKKIIAKIITKRKNIEERQKMQEIAKRFIEKDCLVYLFDGNTVSGIVKDVCDGAVLIERSNKSTEAINSDYIVRIREYPIGKNGKKKSVVLD